MASGSVEHHHLSAAQIRCTMFGNPVSNAMEMLHHNVVRAPRGLGQQEDVHDDGDVALGSRRQRSWERVVSLRLECRKAPRFHVSVAVQLDDVENVGKWPRSGRNLSAANHGCSGLGKVRR